ncbi:acyl-CoA thioesterase [Flavobacterium sp. 25HG05S-40]|uniref:acyl-CoA thioesterase n=1 Tax=Flavobacterium sp. 25HG05S-40 TaxID=3458682 RepID=UPI004043F45F
MNKNPDSTYKIRFTDCDLLGHLNNARYIDYFLNAREDHLKNEYDLDLQSYYTKNLGWVVSHHEIAYLKPARYNEIVLIQSSLFNLGEDFIEVEMVMMDEKKHSLKAIMRTKFTSINIKTGKKEMQHPEFMQWANLVKNLGIDKQSNLKSRIAILTSKSNI